MQTKYRPDIDGLRAIAVTAVVLFHAGIPGVSGGYAGVDVFFVISGFLITQIIYREIEASEFSFARFYERRVRRIIPALFALLVFTSIASLSLLPYDLKQYGKSLAAVPAFLSNFIFWLAAGGYFGDQSPATPLLHTWSLAIEEQFYILFPVTLVLLSRFGRRAVMGGILFLGIISFAFSVVVTLREPQTGFYMPYTRAWELMCGAFVAMTIKPLRSVVVSNLMTMLGLIMVLATVFSFNRDVHLPGYWALLPCVGTGLVIYGGVRPTAVGKLLGFQPVVFLGLISYSLYLWHWPLIVFASYYTLDPACVPLAKGVAAGVSFPAAYLSWRFIERPFRIRDGVMPRPALFRAAFIASLFFATAGTMLWAMKGIPQRFSPQLAMLDPERTHSNADCDASKTCIIGAPDSKPSFVLWGDSHAAALNDGLDSTAKRRGVSGYVFYNLGCRPFWGRIVGADCAAKNMAVAQRLKSLPVKSVIMTARWDAEANQVTRPALLSSTAQMARAAGIRGARVYLLLDVPMARQSVPETLQKQFILGDSSDVLRIPRSEYEEKTRSIRMAIAELASQGSIVILDPESIFCGGSKCAVSRDGLPLYNDTDHLNRRGASLVADRLIAPILALDR
jgi:peptidoglycan/LPS O-acetylase OafA/YrhL